MNSIFSKLHTGSLIGTGVWIVFAMSSFAQTDTASKADHKKHVGMEDQVKALQAEVARLKSAVTTADHQAAPSDQDSASHQPSTSATGSADMSMDAANGKSGMGAMAKGKDNSEGMKMGMMGMEMGMKMMEKGMGMMKSMSGMDGMDSGSGGGMSMGGKSSDSGNGKGMMMGSGKMDGKGMKMMGQMPDASMQTSALPGFAGASHIYHIGSTGFFLDHTDHLGLSTDQQKQLNQIKQAALLEQSEFDRQNEAAEQALWVMTSEGQPDGSAIEKQLADIGVWNSQMRLNFIQAVGKAAEVLTDDQRTKLVGETGDEGKTSSDAHDHKD